MKRNLSVLMALLLLVSIQQSLFAQKKKVDKKAIWFEAPPIAPAFVWEGNYKGTTPCSDCDGIQVVIQLRKDQTYKTISKYLGAGNEVYEVEGKFFWKKEGNYIAMVSGLNPTDTSFALLSKDKLTLLDQKGKRVTGTDAAFYILTKEAVGLSGKYWQLLELNGKPIQIPAGGKDPFLLLAAGNNSFSGHGGCNTLMGNYELSAGNKLTFAGIASTMMACPANELEESFRLALESTDHYNINGNYLIFENSMRQVQAKFKIVFIK